MIDTRERVAPADARPDEWLFPLSRWARQTAELAERYPQTPPFPHIHLADFLDPDVARRVAAAFPATDAAEWIQYRHYNENKLGRTDRANFPEAIGRLIDELNSPAFVAWLSGLTGIPGLMADPSLEGGGMHQTERGGFLNMHADFSHHHHQPRWRRRCNLILYLNDGWRDEWGGALELWDRTMTQCVVQYPPRLNHAVIFSTTDISYHGYPDPITCPAGVTRKSLALYYYTLDGAGDCSPRATRYRARPGDGARAVLVWADNKLLSAYTALKRRLGLSDALASKVLGLFKRKKQ
jgi:hypothetical protein